MINLMMAEDNSDIRRSLCTYLGHKPEIRIVGTAKDGKTAERMLFDCAPDVLLLDLVMPGMDGLELMTRLRATRAQEKTKVIVLSSLMRDDIVQRAMELGATYYMVKPIDPELLYRRIVYFGEERKAAPEPEPSASDAVAERVAQFLGRAGISPASKGYRYLLEALSDPQTGDTDGLRVTKTVYPALSLRFAVSCESVERAIRAAIEAAWKKGAIGRLGLFHGEKRPGNGEFLSRSLEALKQM